MKDKPSENPYLRVGTSILKRVWMISPDETNIRKFILKIGGQPIVKWFREQNRGIAMILNRNARRLEL